MNVAKYRCSAAARRFVYQSRNPRSASAATLAITRGAHLSWPSRLHVGSRLSSGVAASCTRRINPPIIGNDNTIHLHEPPPRVIVGVDTETAHDATGDHRQVTVPSRQSLGTNVENSRPLLHWRLGSTRRPLQA